MLELTELVMVLMVLLLVGMLTAGILLVVQHVVRVVLKEIQGMMLVWFMVVHIAGFGLDVNDLIAATGD